MAALRGGSEEQKTRIGPTVPQELLPTLLHYHGVALFSLFFSIIVFFFFFCLFLFSFLHAGVYQACAASSSDALFAAPKGSSAFCICLTICS